MALVLLCHILFSGCGNPPPPPPAAAPATASPSQASTNQNPAGATNELAMHKAAFQVDAGARDPFFPGSARIPRMLAPKGATNVLPQLPLSSYIRLTGIWPSRTRPLAMINRTTFGPGERGDVTVSIPTPSGEEARKVHVRCLEIHQDSVLISVEGESGTTELKMDADRNDRTRAR